MDALHEPVRHLESDIAIMMTSSRGLLKTFDLHGVTSCISSSMTSNWVLHPAFTEQ